MRLVFGSPSEDQWLLPNHQAMRDADGALHRIPSHLGSKTRPVGMSFTDFASVGLTGGMTGNFIGPSCLSRLRIGVAVSRLHTDRAHHFPSARFD